jgi:hypothetical protein
MHEARVRKGVLTDEACSAVEIGGGEREKWLPWRWKHFGMVLQLHKREGDMRRWSRHSASDKWWRNWLSLAAVDSTCVIRCGGWRRWPMMMKPRAKDAHSVVWPCGRRRKMVRQCGG